MASKNSSYDDFVDYLLFGDTGENNPFRTKTITVNIEGLKDFTAQYNAAKMAMEAWHDSAGFTFKLVTGAAQITIDNEDPDGAYEQTTKIDSDGFATKAKINVEKGWMSDFAVKDQYTWGSYGVQTFIHEIGHALGLNHPGPYNAGEGKDPTYADGLFTRDSKQWTIMSYIEQSDANPKASDLNLYSPMMGDISAIEKMYGKISVNTGDTKWGKGETVWGGNTDFSKHSKSSFTIVDTGGKDIFDVSNISKASRIDLNAGHFSDINGKIGNVSIAKNTTIENAYGTSKGDVILGNSAANKLDGKAGDDTIKGGKGNDTIIGGSGQDTMTGGDGVDTFTFKSVASIVSDHITDFVHGTDKIDLFAIITDAADQSFHWLGLTSYNGDAGDLKYLHKDGDTIIRGDVDGDGASDFSIIIDASIKLSVGDFVI